MVDWATVFDEAHPEPGASERAIADLVRGLGQPMSVEEVARIRESSSGNPWMPTQPEYATWEPIDASAWRMPDRPIPESYLSFLRYSDGGTFRTGDRYFNGMWGTGLREFLLCYNVPQYMPLAVPFCFNGGGVMYMFDMREPAVDGEYPIICAHASCLNFGPYYAPKVADSFPEVCRGRFDVGRLLYGGVVLNAETWDTCRDLKPMLDDCRRSPRKLRLFAVACCRRVAHLLTDDRFHRAIEVAERFADREATDEQRQAAKEACKELRDTSGIDAAANAATESTDSNADQAASDAALFGSIAEAGGDRESPVREAAYAAYVGLLRDIFNNPHRFVPFPKKWRTEQVVGIARKMYDERDFRAVPILADAMEEAGCDNADILAHCREPGVHVRGCWVVDLVLGKH